MNNLIRKDFLLLINYIITCIPISAFLVIIFTPHYPYYGYGMAAVAVAFTLTLSVPSLEARNHTDVIVNSLPVLRTEVIQAKYLSAFVFVILAVLIVALVGLLAHLLPLPWVVPFITWPNIFIAFISMALIISFYYPIFYKFYNNTIVLFTNIILFQFFFFMPSYIESFFNNHHDDLRVRQLLLLMVQSPWVLPVLGVGFAALLLLVSYHLTLKIYSHRDF
ncbi:MAG: ABC-2 transporter permease [Syntrophomonas sp.]